MKTIISKERLIACTRTKSGPQAIQKPISILPHNADKEGLKK